MTVTWWAIALHLLSSCVLARRHTVVKGREGSSHSVGQSYKWAATPQGWHFCLQEISEPTVAVFLPFSSS